MREHAPGELGDELEQARPRLLPGQPRAARAEAFLQREEALRSRFERAPQIFFACVERDAGAKSRADAELGGQAVGADLAADRRSGSPGKTCPACPKKTPAGWKIYDITVEGVSLVLTCRAEFEQITRVSGIEGLIKRLSEKNA